MAKIIDRKTYAGKLSISIDSNDEFHIRLMDAVSSVEILDISVTPEVMALALTGRARQDVSYEIGGTELIGMEQEFREVVVFLPRDADKYEVMAAAESQLGEGWSGQISDLGNGHRLTHTHREGGAAYRVSFSRHVPAA